MKLFGVLSDHRAARSLSPVMHNSVLAGQGIAGAYLPFAVEPTRLGAAVEGLAALGAAGVNVTVPHKQAVMPFLKGLAPEAEALGAVNTLVPTDGGFVGHNTDGGGFLAALARAGMSEPPDRALIFGAGGAARAVAHALKGWGCAEVALTSRDVARTRETARELGCAAYGWQDAPRQAREAGLVVNATSASTPEESPELAGLAAGIELSPDCRLVMDLNYGRGGGMWSDLASRHGLAFQDGLVMLAAQARLSFSLWTGLTPALADFLGPLEAATS